jgi:hypothetical protein
MNTIKTLILASAAAVAASAGAQAADLPVKAKAVQYVKICSLYGAGFYYIPGTDTCIKLGGYVQLDVSLNSNAHEQPAWNGTLGLHNRNSDFFVTRMRNQFNIDTRTQSEYGVVRTFWSSNFQHTSGEQPSAGTITVDFGFIQFAGFTFGKAVSTFQTPWGGSPVGLNTSNLLGGYDNATGITQAAYTWQFGNGVSAQIGVEDSRAIDRAPIFGSGVSLSGTATTAQGQFFSSTFTNAGGGNAAPDILGNIKIDQSAFTVQLSVAGHDIHPTYYGATEPTGHPSDVWGFAVQGGLQLKNLPTGPGDKISVSAIYTDGAPKYVIGGTTGSSFAAFGGTSSPAFYQSVALGTLFDGIYGASGKVEKTKVWGVQGGYEHNWSKQWQTSLFGSYTHVDYNTNATNIFCLANAAVFNAGSTCNPDFNIWQVGTRTAWTPVQNLTLSAEAMYTVLDQSHIGSAASTAAGTAGLNKPAGSYEFKDQGTVSGNLRVRRTW